MQTETPCQTTINDIRAKIAARQLMSLTSFLPTPAKLVNLSEMEKPYTREKIAEHLTKERPTDVLIHTLDALDLFKLAGADITLKPEEFCNTLYPGATWHLYIE